MKRFVKRYEVQTDNYILLTSKLFRALFEFFKAMKKGQECTLGLFYVDKEMIEKEIRSIMEKGKYNGQK